MTQSRQEPSLRLGAGSTSRTAMREFEAVATVVAMQVFEAVATVAARMSFEAVATVVALGKFEALVTVAAMTIVCGTNNRPFSAPAALLLFRDRLPNAFSSEAVSMER